MTDERDESELTTEAGPGESAGLAIAARLKEAMGRLNAAELSRLSGVHDGTIRKYLLGGMPGLDKAASIARTLDVRLEWLATGQPPMRAEAASEDPMLRLDPELLKRCLEFAERVAEASRASGRRWDAEAKASLASRLYDLYREGRAEAATRELLDALPKLDHP